VRQIARNRSFEVRINVSEEVREQFKELKKNPEKVPIILFLERETCKEEGDK